MESDSLQFQLLYAFLDQNETLLAELIEVNSSKISESFGSWLALPPQVPTDDHSLEVYAGFLFKIAQRFDGNGDSSLMDQLHRKPGKNPIEEWQKVLRKVDEMIEKGEYMAAKVLVASMIEEIIGRYRGSAADKALPRAYGRLGIVNFQLGHNEAAIKAFTTARKMCLKIGDKEGAKIYQDSIEMVKE